MSEVVVEWELVISEKKVVGKMLEKVESGSLYCICFFLHLIFFKLRLIFSKPPMIIISELFVLIIYLILIKSFYMFYCPCRFR